MQKSNFFSGNEEEYLKNFFGSFKVDSTFDNEWNPNRRSYENVRDVFSPYVDKKVSFRNYKQEAKTIIRFCDSSPDLRSLYVYLRSSAVRLIPEILEDKKSDKNGVMSSKFYVKIMSCLVMLRNKMQEYSVQQVQNGEKQKAPSQDKESAVKITNTIANKIGELEDLRGRLCDLKDQMEQSINRMEISLIDIKNRLRELDLIDEPESISVKPV